MSVPRPECLGPDSNKFPESVSDKALWAMPACHCFELAHPHPNILFSMVFAARGEAGFGQGAWQRVRGVLPSVRPSASSPASSNTLSSDLLRCVQVQSHEMRIGDPVARATSVDAGVGQGGEEVTLRVSKRKLYARQCYQQRMKSS